jgi:pimeloyl-ACP methyl ester carboxylesterase
VLSASPNYITAWQNSRPAGAHIAELIEFLVAETGAKTEDFHIIGHSLGGHVAGFAGNSTTTGKVGRITGLCFSVKGLVVETSVGLNGQLYSIKCQTLPPNSLCANHPGLFSDLFRR